MKEFARHMMVDFMQMTQFFDNPFVVTGGQGVRITDANGKEYLDALAGVFVVSVGHGNRAVIDAMTAQLHRLSFGPPLHGTNPPALELTGMLGEIGPAGLTGVKFLSGGSEATEAAVKLARQYHQQTGHPRKYKFIAKYGGYHGATMGALSATGSWERKSVFEPLVPGFIHVHPPYCYRCPFDKTYPSCLITCARLIERTIAAEDPETVAAVILDPISISSAGFIVPPPEYFQIVREACDRHNVLLIYDEIITGFGRLGTMFAADYFGVAPDLLCCGKGMSGGYAPLAAVLMRDRVYDAFLGRPEERREFHHGHTYGGNPVACAAGLATIREILDRRLVQNAKAMGAHLRARLEAMATRFSLIGEVRGAGLLQGMELVADRVTRASFPPGVKPGKLIEREARARGLLMRCGTDFIAFAPPLVVTRQEIDEMCDITEACLAAVEAQIGAARA